MSKAGFW